jgi:hypothetical protein
MITRSTQLIRVIARTEETMDITASNPQSRRRRGLFDVSMTQRSGARFIAPRGTIWKSARLFWIGRRYNHHLRRHDRSPDELINTA